MGAPETEVINFQFLFHQNTVGSDKNESQVHMFYNQLFNIYHRCVIFQSHTLVISIYSRGNE